jgi:hypothetical protein
MEGPINLANNYGTRLRGYLYPPASGRYTFWIAGDANSELWLSTSADPCSAVKIAYTAGATIYPRDWSVESYQQSLMKTLTAGQKYYINVLHKEDTGIDDIAVAWRGPSFPRQIIDGVYLSPYLYDFKDFSIFGAQWQRFDCAITNAWCSGADRDRDGNIQIDDLIAFAQWWLLETN